MAQPLSTSSLRAGVVAVAVLFLVPCTDAARRPKLAKGDREMWVTMASADLARLRSKLGGRQLDRLPVAYEEYDGVTVALTTESGLDDLAVAMHERFARCAGFVAHETHAEALRWMYASLAPEAPAVNYTIDNGPTVNAIMAQTSAANIVSTIATMSAYPTRHYQTQNGYDAAAWVKSQWESIAASRSDVRVSFFDHPTWLQHSVIATIRGTDFPKEVVVVGAHLDSIRSDFNPPIPQATPAPGADDDASGVASITEAFRAAIAAGYRPARTVKFMAYSAEEGGLRGSKEIATAMNPTSGLTKMKVIGAFQLDMTNFKSSAVGAVDVGIFRDDNWTDDCPNVDCPNSQNQFVRNLLVQYLPSLTFNYSPTNTCGYACSDHAAWKVQGGVPASIAFEGTFGQHSPNLHTANDTLANADPTGQHALKFAKLAAAYMAELAKGTIVP